MENQFVPYDIALKLKELGVNIKCIATIDQTKYLHIKGTKSSPRGSMVYDTIDCPLFSQVFEFFRNNNNMHHDIVHQESSSQEWYDAYVEGEKIDEFGTYRQAEIACINKLIELVYDK